MIFYKIFFVLLLTYSMKSNALVYLECGTYKFVGHYYDETITVHQNSMSELNINNIFTDKNKNQVKKLGVPLGGIITARVNIHSLNENSIDKGEILSLTAPTIEEIQSINSSSAVSLTKKRPCIK